MYKLCKTEESAARQRELEHGLLNAMSVLSYEQISVSDLCQQIGIPRKAFYRYFSGKEGALHALIDHTLLEFESVAFERGTGAHYLVSFFTFWQGKQELLDALERSALSDVLIQRAVNHALSAPAVGRCSPNTWEKADSRLFLVGGLMSVMLRWHRDGYPVPAKQMGAAATRLLSKPLIQEVAELF